MGTNAQLPRFCSEVDSVLLRDLRGEHLWVNPDFTLILEVLKHFRQAYQLSPHNTSGTFLLPEWTNYPFWRLTKGAVVIARYPRGTSAFTSPDWRALAGQSGNLTYGTQRTYRGPTRWPFVVIHFPCTVSCRPASSGRPHPRLAGQGQARQPVRVLRGDPAADGLLLRGLPPGLVH